MKKTSASYPQVKQTKESAHTNSALSAKTKAELKKLGNKKDFDIDRSNIPELDFEKLGKPEVGRFYRPIKKLISIQLDADVLDWFKYSAKQYQTLINDACREYMQHHQQDRR